MSKLFEGKTMSELVDQGWIIIADEDTNEIVGIRSVIQTWKSLTWAEQTYYRAKYGFNEAGILDIGLSGQVASTRKTGLFLRPLPHSEVVTPARSSPGSDDRLREVLAQSRVAVESLRYTDGLTHTGPDGTVIITDEYLWGIPDGHCGDEVSRSYSCIWEDSPVNWANEAPWWALPSSTGESPELHIL